MRNVGVVASVHGCMRPKAETKTGEKKAGDKRKKENKKLFVCP